MTTYRSDDEHGPRWFRRPYDARSYTVPPDWLPKLRASYGRYHSQTDLLVDDPEGPFRGSFIRMRDLVRDGKRWVTLQVTGGDWMAEIEADVSHLGEVRLLPPEEAWLVARAHDAMHVPPIEVRAPPPKR